MSEFNIDDFQADAESTAGEYIQKIADFIADKKKALAGGAVATGIAALTSWLGADSPVVVSVTGLAVTLGVFVAPANNALRKVLRKATKRGEQPELGHTQ